jgi:hypothetical protein
MNLAVELWLGVLLVLMATLPLMLFLRLARASAQTGTTGHQGIAARHAAETYDLARRGPLGIKGVSQLQEASMHRSGLAPAGSQPAALGALRTPPNGFASRRRPNELAASHLGSDLLGCLAPRRPRPITESRRPRRSQPKQSASAPRP